MKPKDLLFVFVFFLYTSCSTGVQTSGCDSAQDKSVPFSYSKDRGMIVFQGSLQDTISLNLILDTGIGERFILKSSVAQKKSKNSKSARQVLKSGFNLDLYEARSIEDSISVTIGKDTIVFSSYSVVEDDSSLGRIIGENDGIMPITLSMKTLAIFNSDHTLSIKPNRRGDYSMGFSMKRDKYGRYVIQGFPLSFGCDQETIEFVFDYILDTGYRGELALNGMEPPAAMSSFLTKFSTHIVKKKNTARNAESYVYRIPEVELLKRSIWIENNLPNRSYSDVFETSSSLIGTELLKGFDFLMDFEKDSLFLKPIPYISILDEGDGGPFFQGRRDNDGRICIMYIKTKSPCDEAGVIPGDILESINGKPYYVLRDSLNDGLLTEPIVFSVYRNGEKLTLTSKAQNN